MPPRSLVERGRDWVAWFGAGRLAATALAVLGVVVAGVWLLRPSPAPPESNLPYASRTSTTVTTGAEPDTVTTTSGAPTAIVIHVAGHVAAPGIYTLPAGARVDDAVRAAGGVTPDADLDMVNLAAVVQDGQRVYVPAAGEAVPIDEGPVAPTVAMFPVNINTATADQLDVLPGVGPATAAAIIARRQEHGPFQSVDELGDVRGIGPAKLDALRGLVTV